MNHRQEPPIRFPNSPRNPAGKVLKTLVLLCLLLEPAAAQRRFKVPTQAPANAPWKITLVDPDEPGAALVVAGTVYAADGTTAVAGAGVFVYQTGADGLYGPEGNTNPRLRGYMRTNREGRYELRTIKPGAYPGGGVAAHIHYHVTPPNEPNGAEPEEQVSEVVFEGDPFVTERLRRNPHFSVRPLERRGEVLHLTYDVQLSGK